jgi:Bax inhibitor 1
MNIFQSSTNNLSWKAIGDFSDLTDEVQDHVKNVYTTLVGLIGMASLGVYLQISLRLNSSLLSFLGFILLIVLAFKPYSSNESQTTRLGLLFGFAFCEGISIAPFINSILREQLYTIGVKNSSNIVLVAFLSTLTLFVSFSMVAIFSKRRSFLYLGGFLMSGLNIMLLFSFLSMFGFSAGVSFVLLYGGLLIFSGYVIYDTQLMIERAHLGEKDYVQHSLQLFIDFVAIFIRILIILNQKKKKNEDEE